MIEGSCGCGGVQFEIAGPVSMSRYCHCANCRKFSGTAQSAWGLAESADFKITAQSSAVSKYDAGSGGLRVFCAACGSPLWFEPKNMPEYRGIDLGAIDSGTVAAPGSHWWVASNPSWAAIADDLPCFESTPQAE